MVDLKNVRRSICRIGKLLYERNLTDSSGGNISVRDGNLIYINPRRSGHDHQWDLAEDDILVTDLCKVPVTGSSEMISREASTHYLIYQNFPDINSVIHGHPFYMMAFGAAHMEIPAISEGTRAVLGFQPITNINEVVPGSVEQAEEVVSNFKKRRQIDPGCPLICGLPFHGSFSAGATLNDAFMYTEVANNCARILIYRQLMFGNDPRADFKVQKQFTKDDFKTTEVSKEVCQPGYVYTDIFGRSTVYGGEGKKTAKGPSAASGSRSQQDMVSKITEEVLKKLGRI